MQNRYLNLTTEQSNTAVQRLTALWAFCESGLGGVMHALQIPFTGLVLGGMAVILITFIAQLSDVSYKKMLHSLVIVLIIKAMVSPHTPFPAYIAVSFQALLGFVLFYFLRINFISIFLLSILAMAESAIQQLLILTLFFGKSFWNAVDQLMKFIIGQFGINESRGSLWLIGLYLFIYILGGLLIAIMTYKIIRGSFAEGNTATADRVGIQSPEFFFIRTEVKKKNHYTLWIISAVMIIVSILLFVFAKGNKNGWIAVLKTISWTLSAIIAWYLVISPLFTKFILNYLQKKQSRYHQEVAGTLSFIPVLRQLTVVAWKESISFKGWGKWYFFISTLLRLSLTYSDVPAVSPVAKEQP